MFFIIALVVFFLDQASKFAIISKMSQGQSIAVLDNIFHITYIHNAGAAFGLFANQTSFFIVITLLVITAMVIFYWRLQSKDGILPISLGLIVGGSLGNLVDRVRFGEVIDFLDFRIWPVFNLADSAIVIGAALLGVVLWKMDSKS